MTEVHFIMHIRNFTRNELHSENFEIAFKKITSIFGNHLAVEIVSMNLKFSTQ